MSWDQVILLIFLGRRRFRTHQNHCAEPLARSDNVLTFYSPTEAISWAVEQGAFADSFTAEVAYEQLKAEIKPRHAKEMYIIWIGHVRKQKPQRRPA